jgi:hypothetical protein
MKDKTDITNKVDTLAQVMFSLAGSSMIIGSNQKPKKRHCEKIRGDVRKLTKQSVKNSGFPKEIASSSLPTNRLILIAMT